MLNLASDVSSVASLQSREEDLALAAGIFTAVPGDHDRCSDVADIVDWRG